MELAIDSVGPSASVAVSDGGRVLAEISWPTGRRHTPTLVPMIDAVCKAAAIERAELEAVFVDVGPGAYGGIRAGMAAAAALATVLDLAAVGMGRLEIEAYGQAAVRGPIVALHDAGRGQWALAIYQGPAAHWRELAAPTLVTPRALAARLDELRGTGVLCGEADRLPPAVVEHLTRLGWTVAGGAANMRRAALLAELAYRDWDRGRAAGRDFPAQQLEPLYLREPAIGPQAPVVEEAFPLETKPLETKPLEANE